MNANITEIGTIKVDGGFKLVMRLDNGRRIESKTTFATSAEAFANIHQVLERKA